MKILLGGIPLGCDNIGDEAIIAGVVKMLKESVPGVELTVATADAATAQLLGVSVVPPFGFASAPLPLDCQLATQRIRNIGSRQGAARVQ